MNYLAKYKPQTSIFEAFELAQAEAKGAEKERERLMKIVAKIPITGWDTDGTRVASRLLKELSNQQEKEL